MADSLTPMPRRARGPTAAGPSRSSASGSRPERWTVDAGDAALATLVVPPDAQRERRFEISCAMTVRRAEAADGAWHQLTVLADSSMQWQRRVATHPGSDGLDYRFERRVAPGQALRISAEVSCHAAQRRALLIEVDEISD